MFKMFFVKKQTKTALPEADKCPSLSFGSFFQQYFLKIPFFYCRFTGVVTGKCLGKWFSLELDGFCWMQPDCNHACAKVFLLQSPFLLILLNGGVRTI